MQSVRSDSSGRGNRLCCAVHAAFYALDLGTPAAVEATTSELKPESYPLWTVLRYEFAAKGDRPAVTLTWYDGGKMPPRPRALSEGTALSGNGIYFVGDKGTLVCDGWSGPPTLYSETRRADRMGRRQHEGFQRPRG